MGGWVIGDWWGGGRGGCSLAHKYNVKVGKSGRILNMRTRCQIGWNYAAVSATYIKTCIICPVVSWARNEYYKLQWWLTDSNILAAFVQCSFSTLQKHPILKTLWMFVQTELHILHLCVYGLETRWEMWLRFSVRVCLLSKCICEYMSAGILRVNSNVLLHLSFLAPAGDALLHRNLKIPPSWWCEPCPQSSTKYFPNMEQSCHFF